MSRVYLSGPISLNGTLGADEIGYRIAVFTSHAKRLRAAGYEVTNPCEVDDQPSWEAYMRIHIPSVCAADIVAVLPDWEKSRGSALEVFVATQLLTPIVRVEELAA